MHRLEPAVSDSGDNRVPVRDWLPWLVVLATIWGSSFLFMKVAVVEVHPLWVAAGRLVFGAAALGVILAVRRLRLPTDPGAWLHGAVLGVVNCAIPFSLFAFAGERIPSLLSGLWNTATPLVVLPLAVLAFRTEKFSVRGLLGLGLGLVGGLVLLGVWDLSGEHDLAGQLMCLGGITCYGIGMAWSRRFISPRPESPLVAALLQLLCGTVVIVPVALLTVGPPGVAGVPALSSVAALGALGTGVAFALNLRNIARLGASRAATVTYLVPVVATVVGVLALGERLSPHHVVGGLVVAAGVAIAQGVLGGRGRPGSLLARGSAGGGPAAGLRSPDDGADHVAGAGQVAGTGQADGIGVTGNRIDEQEVR